MKKKKKMNLTQVLIWKNNVLKDLEYVAKFFGGFLFNHLFVFFIFLLKLEKVFFVVFAKTKINLVFLVVFG